MNYLWAYYQLCFASVTFKHKITVLLMQMEFSKKHFVKWEIRLPAPQGALPKLVLKRRTIKTHFSNALLLLVIVNYCITSCQ